MRKLVTLCISILLLQNLAFASVQPVWKSITERQALEHGKREIQVSKCSYFEMDPAALMQYLQNAPMERSGKPGILLTIPSASGELRSFEVVESPVMEAELAAKYPMIKTWSGQGIENRDEIVRLDITKFGFHAMIYTGNGTEFVDPINLNATTIYMSYRKSDAIRSTSLTPACGFNPDSEENIIRSEELKKEAELNRTQMTQRSIGSQLKTYRLALACTGEYANVYGSTAADSITGPLSGMVTSVNRVNQAFEKEMCMHLNLIAKTDTLIFFNTVTDGYTNNVGSTMLQENQVIVTTRIGISNYDIGHVFSTGGGGIAHLGSVCLSTSKARGVTGLPNPVGDAFDIDFVAHEMGHQFGGNHTFNGTTGNCNGVANTSTAYEPGSGTTIMAYAGICPPQNVQLHSDDYYHTVSFDEIQNYVQTGSGSFCDVLTPTGNNAPVITSTTGNYNIPILTPFRLTGAANDPDGDPITYTWEEYDLGPLGNPATPQLNAPIFRGIEGTSDPVRLCPKLNTILAGLTAKDFERLPSYARNVKFRLTVRDNRSGGGGVTYENTLTNLTVVNTTTAFEITTANSAGTVYGGWTLQPITWNVSSTDVAPINTTNVNILMSTDSGQTFPIVLKANVPNDGSDTIPIPNVNTTKARIMIEAVGNVFFDINNSDITITASTGLNESGVEGEIINAYPNPFSDNITWNMSGKYRGAFSARLTDVSGREIYNASFEKHEAAFQQVIDVAGLSKGVYFLQIETLSGRAVSKLMKN